MFTPPPRSVSAALVINYEWARLFTQPERIGPEWNAEVAATFTAARNGENNLTPTALVPLALTRLPLPQTPALVGLTALAAQLAERPLPGAYHNPHHAREVMALTLAQLSAHVHSGAEPRLSGDDIWLTLATSAAHDLSHNGIGNRGIYGEHVPMLLEHISLETLRHASKYHDSLKNLSPEVWDRINSMLMPTDVSKAAPGEESPADHLAHMFQHKANGDDTVYQHERLLEEDPALLLCAGIISDADLGASAGLDFDFALARTAEVMQEIGGTPGVKAYHGFMNFVATDFPISPPGRALFGDTKQRLLQQASAALGAPAPASTIA